MRLFGSFFLFMILWVAGAEAYKLCMAQHVKPTSCTKSGSYGSWTLACTGGTVTKMWGHCGGTFESNGYHEGNCYYIAEADIRCSLDAMISNGQLVDLNITIYSYHTSSGGCYTYNNGNYQSGIYNSLTAAAIISQIPF
jgi:hypothetical protein